MTETRPTPAESDAAASSGPSRRQVLRGGAAAAAGVGATVALTACGGGESGGAPKSSGESLTVAKADVPVGGGLILETKYVVTQPEAGQFKAFDKSCPHQGCAVSMIQQGSIVCTCHTSLFSVADGSRVSGPARTGLREVAVADDGDTLKVG